MYEVLKPKSTFLNYPWLNTDDIVQNKFKFLNAEAEFANEIEWHDQSKNRLWRYNLHYFQYLFPKNNLPQSVAINLISDWIAKNPPFTEDAWEPYPTSLRIVNWIKYLSITEASEDKVKHICKSLHEQTSWLEKSLEFDQLGNHVFKNAKALFFAGLFLKSKDSERWLRKSIKLLKTEIDEEILADGGHVERSPMYHSMILEDCLDIINVAMNHSYSEVSKLVEHLSEITRKMLDFLIETSHPDGQISLMNDAAYGVEPAPSQLDSYFQRLTGSSIDPDKSGIKAFTLSGYFTISPRSGDFMIIDCGPLGPDYQPGHGHCDALSFELSLKGQRVIVDSGCFSYDVSEIRDYNRGNWGHNTLTINDQNQSEVWDGFRCARRAYPLDTKIWQEDDKLFFEGAHDGYKRLKGKLIHHRRVSWIENVISIEDKVSGKYEQKYALNLNFHPKFIIDLKDNCAYVKDGTKSILKISALNKEELKIMNGWYCPEFGKKNKNDVLTFQGEAVAPFNTGWEIRII